MNANNSYKDSSDDFGVTETFVELDLLIIFASYSFSLSVIVFKILAENGKNRQNSRLKANNSYKESSDDFGVTETFVELDLLNNFALYSFSLSVIVLEILAKNRKNHQNLRLNASNSYKESSDDFGAIETFVELDLLNIFVSPQFFFICYSFRAIRGKLSFYPYVLFIATVAIFVHQWTRDEKR